MGGMESPFMALMVDGVPIVMAYTYDSDLTDVIGLEWVGHVGLHSEIEVVLETTPDSTPIY